MVLKRMEDVEGQVNATGIVLSAHGVGADKPAVELLAEPVAQLRLQHPMAQRAVVAT